MMNGGEKNITMEREKLFHKGQEDSLLHQRREAPGKLVHLKLYFLTPLFAPFLYIHPPSYT